MTGSRVAALAVLAFILGAASLLARSQGSALGLALAFGAVLGAVLQRSRFCFLCHARDWIERRDPRGMLAILLALAVAAAGYHLLMPAWLPRPLAPRLPPDAFIGPVSLALPLAGLVFGVGMAISGSCISAHLYRLGEGSPVAPFALLGAVVGLGLGFATWNQAWSLAVAGAPPLWLPHYLGYDGSLAATLVALGALALLLRRLAGPAAAVEPGLLAGRWPYWVGGLVVGVLTFAVVLRLPPLGVTAALSAAARGAGDTIGALPARLDGLDLLKGCAALASEGALSPNLPLIAGIVLGGLAAALASGQFSPRWPTSSDAIRGLAGGLLLGWGAMTALGCTVGALLSGVAAGAVSGWAFALAAYCGVWAGLRLRSALTRDVAAAPA